MKKEQLDLFGLILYKIKNYKGYTVFSILKDADPGANLYRFDTKEEFDKVFTLRNGCYVESIDDDEIYSDDGFYLAIDGKLVR